MNRVATADAVMRARAFAEAGARLRMPAAIIEKDFWVCWLLGLLFDASQSRDGRFVFKGGTALSKVFRVINRFSEDIDLSLDPAVLGIRDAEVEALSGRKKTDDFMKRVEALCGEWVRDELMPELNGAIVGILGERAGHEGWLEYEEDADSRSPVLYFRYPCDFPDEIAYIRRAVKLEFGSLTDQRPTGRHRVQPWLAETMPGEMREMGCDVVALNVERAFWEKATILHAEHHRDPSKAMPVRYSRHYADLAELARSGYMEDAVANTELRQRVVDWKNRFFARAAARYDLARPGTFRLIPPEHRMEELKKDFAAMQEMFMGDAPKLPTILETLRALEERINAEAAVME
ncbi:nucleotidyl transferase AbiEii/AbiGii toxin family protein [Prosthecobacter sp.]|uniref:nucleotidyl transferase AbiEii/AbiGii toxin family protein n=1 Tax=Prosthecobacter sp. TaxID=1965333 RepID=UPI00378471FD